MKRILLTGGTGFVGANLARRLVRDGHAVHLLVRAEHSPWRLDGLRDDVRLHEVRLDDADAVGRVVGAVRPDWVFHLAAHGAYSWQTDLSCMVQTNIVGTMTLVQACLRTGFEAFVNTGSSSEYGWKDHAPSETDWLEPNSHYAVTKASATLFCRLTAQQHNVRIPTLRLYSVYGPYEDPGRLLPAVIVHGLRGDLPPLVNPRVARDYVYVDDVSDAYLRAATGPLGEPGAVYNIGTGVQTDLAEVVRVARRVLGIKAEPQWGSMPNRQWDTNVWVADSRRVREELGWPSPRSFEQGFRLLVDWFRAQPQLLDHYQGRMSA